MTKLKLIALAALAISIISVNVGCKKSSTTPSITLNGANPMNVTLNTSYTEPGATSSDGSTVSYSGTVNANLKGTYTITYTANGASATRTVYVVNSVDFLQGTYNVKDTTSGYSTTYHATVTSSSTTNYNLSISNFGGFSDTLNIPFSYKSSDSTFSALRANPIDVGLGRKIYITSPCKLNTTSPFKLTFSYVNTTPFTSTYTK